MSLCEPSPGRWALALIAFVAFAALPVSASAACDAASLPSKIKVAELAAGFPKDKIPFPQSACIVDSATTAAGTERTTYAEALAQETLAQLEAHFVKVLESSGFKTSAKPIRDTLRSKPRVHLRYAGPGATVYGGTVFKGTGVGVTLIEDSAYPGWRLVRVSVSEKGG